MERRVSSAHDWWTYSSRARRGWSTDGGGCVIAKISSARARERGDDTSVVVKPSCNFAAITRIRNVRARARARDRQRDTRRAVIRDYAPATARGGSSRPVSSPGHTTSPYRRANLRGSAISRTATTVIRDNRISVEFQRGHYLAIIISREAQATREAVRVDLPLWRHLIRATPLTPYARGLILVSQVVNFDQSK